MNSNLARWIDKPPMNTALAEHILDDSCGNLVIEVRMTNAGYAVYYNEWELEGFTDDEIQAEAKESDGHVYACGPYKSLALAQAAAETWLFEAYGIKLTQRQQGAQEST